MAYDKVIDFVKLDADLTTVADAIRSKVYDALNQGQQKKLVKDEAVKALFDLYGVEYGE